MRAAISLGLALIAAPAFAEPVYNAPADVRAIVHIEKIDAIDLDMNQVIANYAPDAVVYDLIAPGVYKGRAQIFAGFEPQVKVLKNITGSFPSISVFSDGTMACAATQMAVMITPIKGPNTPLSLRQLDVLQKVNGRWLVTEEHLSFPADPKTGMSLLDATQTPAAAMDFTKPFAGPRIDTVAAEAQIKEWTNRFALAATPSELLALMGPGDNEMIFDMFSPTVLQGRQAITAAYGPGLAQISDVTVGFSDFRADSDGYIGAQIDTQNLGLQMKNGSTLNWKLRQSDCLHDVNGHWLSVFDSLSFPVNWKTGKTVMN